MNIEQILLKYRDEKNAAFVSRLIPTIDASTIIGIRSPQLHKIAKELTLNGNDEPFLNRLPHYYLEEDLIHAILLSNMKDCGKCIEKVKTFAPYITNWSVCDTLHPTIFKKHHDELTSLIDYCLSSPHLYTIRLGVGLLNSFCLDNEVFEPNYLTQVAHIERNEYYIEMMQAWYFATALAKQWDSTIHIIPLLSQSVKKKTIQKAIESKRIDDKQKSYLRSLRKQQ